MTHQQIERIKEIYEHTKPDPSLNSAWASAMHDLGQVLDAYFEQQRRLDSVLGAVSGYLAGELDRSDLAWLTRDPSTSSGTAPAGGGRKAEAAHSENVRCYVKGCPQCDPVVERHDPK